MKGSKILLVDDEVVFTTNMGKLLTNRGYKVTSVNSGDAAIQALEKENYDVVVLDLKMPGMDGIATLKGNQEARPFHRNADPHRPRIHGHGFQGH